MSKLCIPAIVCLFLGLKCHSLDQICKVFSWEFAAFVRMRTELSRKCRLKKDPELFCYHASDTLFVNQWIVILVATYGDNISQLQNM